MPIGTQTAPSARTVGDFRQSLVFLHVSRLPVLYILVLEVGYLLHKRPSGVLVVSEGHSPDAYRPSEGTQWDPNARSNQPATDQNALQFGHWGPMHCCLLYTSPSPRDGLLSRMPSSA